MDRASFPIGFKSACFPLHFFSEVVHVAHPTRPSSAAQSLLLLLLQFGVEIKEVVRKEKEPCCASHTANSHVISKNSVNTRVNSVVVGVVEQL